MPCMVCETPNYNAMVERNIQSKNAIDFNHTWLLSNLNRATGTTKTPPLVVTNGFNYGRGLHLFISNLKNKFDRIFSPRESRIIYGTICSSLSTQYAYFFHRKTSVTNHAYFRYQSPEEYSGLDLSPGLPSASFNMVFFNSRCWWQNPLTSSYFRIFKHFSEGQEIVLQAF